MNKKMTMIEVKEKLRSDASFRSLFPEYEEEINNFLLDPSCPCNANLYKKIIEKEEKIKYHKNTSFVFKVINTNTEELEEVLKSFPQNSKVESMARYENEITIILRYLK